MRGARQHVGEKQALVDLDAVLVALAVSGFGRRLPPCVGTNPGTSAAAA